MSEKDNEKITRTAKDRAYEVARIISKLPEKEAEKIYYMAKYAEFFDTYSNANMPRTAAH